MDTLTEHDQRDKPENSVTYDTRQPRTRRGAKKPPVKQPDITGIEYGSFEQAYDWFNAQLFDTSLPACLITLQRKARTGGYYAHNRFEHRHDATIRTAELALNPDHFKAHDLTWTLSVLVHEMAHCWQAHQGTPSRGAYHNKEWGTQMEALGLMPSTTGQPGGKRTGQSMSHYILDGGPFAHFCKVLLATGFQLNWQSVPLPKKKGPNSKTKFTCPVCGLNAWAKADARIECHDDHMLMEIEQ